MKTTESKGDAEQQMLDMKNVHVQLAHHFVEDAMKHFNAGNIGRALVCIDCANDHRELALDSLTITEMIAHHKAVMASMEAE